MLLTECSIYAIEKICNVTAHIRNYRNFLENSTVSLFVMKRNKVPYFPSIEILMLSMQLYSFSSYVVK
jgi:hypothetical protein